MAIMDKFAVQLQNCPNCANIMIYSYLLETLIMINRKLKEKLIEAAKGFPIISVIGPRQSGKTTLAKMTFPDYEYVSLENMDNRVFAQTDPRGFLKRYKSKVILDEVQRVPHLFSYMQEVVDEANQPGQYIITGSQNFLLLESITQSLAGRIAIFELLPFSMQEMNNSKILPLEINELIFKGFYPRVYERDLSPLMWYQNYITTYLERDVRQVLNVKNISEFQKFLALCAGRCGQLISFSALANDCGVSVNTVKSWISILESSFVIYLLRPHSSNFNKRIIKSPKLYFYDTGLACSLLGIEKSEQVQTHYLRGALFENLIIIELLKRRYNLGKRSNLYFWRDKLGNEVDCILNFSDKLIPIEIKSAQTFDRSFIKNLEYYKKLSDSKDLYLIYSGDFQANYKGVKVLPWGQLTHSLYFE